MDDKCKVCKNREDMCSYSTAMLNLCKRNGFDAFSPVTNADKYFRNATDEELAERLVNACWHCCPPHNENCIGYCRECWLNWLKHEVEE